MTSGKTRSSLRKKKHKLFFSYITTKKCFIPLLLGLNPVKGDWTELVHNGFEKFNIHMNEGTITDNKLTVIYKIR